MLDSLAPKEADVLRRYCGLEGPPETMRALAEEYGLTVTRVNQLKQQALSHLRADREFMSLAHDYSR